MTQIFKLNDFTSLLNYNESEIPLFINRQNFIHQQHAAHIHDCMELVYVLRGGGSEQINNKSYPVLKGDLYFLNENDIHTFHTQDRMEIFNLMFKISLFNDFEKNQLDILKKLFRDKNHISKYSLSPPFQDKISTMFNSLHREIREQVSGWQLAAKLIFCRIMLELQRYISNDSFIGAQVSGTIASRRAIDYIHNHFNHPISIKELAAACKVGRNYIGELFKKNTGLPISKYINLLRVQKAMRLIEATEFSLSEIAYEVGFCDSSHFSKQFKAQTGISPRTYRQRLRSKNATKLMP